MKPAFRLIPVLLFLSAMPCLAQKVVIIANRSTRLETISTSDLRDIFLGGLTRFSNGTVAVPVLQRSGPEHDQFLKDYVGKVDSSFRSGWRSLVFTGQASMPKVEDGDAAMLSFVASTPGAIGYINKSSTHENVIILTVK